MFIAASAFEAWREHFVTVKQIVAEKSFSVCQPLLSTTYILWTKGKYNLLLGRDPAPWTMAFRRTWRRNNDGYVLPTSRASAFEAWKEHVVTVKQIVAEERNSITFFDRLMDV